MDTGTNPETSAEEYRLLTQLFLQLSGLSASERSAALDHADCSERVRGELEHLLEKHDAGTSVFDQPALGPGFDLDESAQALSIDARLAGRRMDGYHLEQLIASGGMGSVYRATQENPSRTVAVKVLKAGASREALRRFAYEAQILAHLRHPEIAQVLQVGEFEIARISAPREAPGGAEERIVLPYFAMEYVPGARTLTEYAQAKSLDLRERLKLFARVCRAVHHGHQKGVIHRDLKPTNLLVDSSGCPKVIDFGIARATDGGVGTTSIHTALGQVIGTLQYMSPEQCDGDPDELDTRTDIYSLGVVMYELLCARLPYDVSTVALHECLRTVREVRPARPSEIDHKLRGDPETILLKALQKERERRYQSAAELAADIERFLEDQPIFARPPSAIYQIRMFSKRHRALAGSLVSVFVILVVAVVAISIALSREATQRSAAEEARAEAERQGRIAEAVNDFLRNDLLRSVSPLELGHEVSMRAALDAAADALEGRFQDQPMVAATLHQTIGRTYLDLGVFESAEHHLQAAISQFEEKLQPGDEAVLGAQLQLADLYANDSRLGEAEALATLVLEAARRTPGGPSTAAAAALSTLGVVQVSRSEYAEAAPLHAEALDIYRAHGGERDLDTVRAMGNLAVTYRHLGRFHEARSLYEEALAISRAEYGPDHPDTQIILANLATFYSVTGDHERALALDEELVASMERTLPEDHYRTLIAKSNLALVYQDSDRLQDALGLLEETLPRMREVLGDGDYYTLIAANNLAGLYRELNRLDEAEELFEQTLGDMAASLGEDHEYFVHLLGGLAQVHAKRARYEEAEAIYRTILDMLARKFPARAPNILTYRQDHADACLRPWGKLEEAERELLDIYRISSQDYGDAKANRGTATIVQSLVDLYAAWGKREEAGEWRKRLGPSAPN